MILILAFTLKSTYINIVDRSSLPMSNLGNQINQKLIQTEPTYRSKLYISLMTWTLAMSMFHFGYYLIYITQIPTDTLKQIFTIDLENGLTQGLLNGLVPIGGLFGALASSFFIDRFSRRTNMIIANVFCFVIGCLIYVQNFPMLIICRFCQGLATGFFTSIAPLMVRQLSPNQIAGAIGSYTELNICIGVVIGCLAPYCMLKVTGDESAKAYWYLVFGIPQIIIVLQTIIMVFVFPYETPKYLLMIGEEEEAKRLIEVIYKPQYVEQVLEEKKLDLKNISLRHSQMKSQQQSQKSKKKSLFSFFTVPAVMALHVASLQQLSGINIVSIYAQNVSKEVTTGQLALILPTLINLLELLATFFSFFLLHRVGRRKVLLYGSLIGGIANLIIMFGYFTKDDTSYGTALLLVGIFVFIVNFGLTLGPVAWIFIPEIVQPKVIPYSTTVSWISGSIVIVLFPILTEDYLNGNPAILFAFSTIWCLGSAVVNYFFIIETKDKVEKDIREEYKKIKVCPSKQQ